MPTDKQLGERYHLRLDDTLMEQVRYCAKANGQTLRDFMEDAIRTRVRAEVAARNDKAMDPIIADILSGNLKAHGASLRKMLVRLAYEVLRLQYLLCEFLVAANLQPSEVERWREEGWKWAVKAFKHQPTVPNEDAEA